MAYYRILNSFAVFCLLAVTCCGGEIPESGLVCRLTADQQFGNSGLFESVEKPLTLTTDKRSIEFNGTQSLKSKRAVLPGDCRQLTILAVAQADAPFSLPLLAFRESGKPFVQLDVDEFRNARFIVRDAQGTTLNATIPACFSQTTIFGGVLKSNGGQQEARVLLDKTFSEPVSGVLRGSVVPETAFLGGMKLSDGATYHWQGTIFEILIYDRALSNQEIEQIRSVWTKQYALKTPVFPKESRFAAAPRKPMPDSWNILNRPKFDGAIDKELETDVCVVGAGSAGSAAAIEAAREGAKVVLVERQKNVGGTGASGMVSNWEGGPGCDLCREFFDRMKAIGGAGVGKETPCQITAPHGYKIVCDEPYDISCVRAKPPKGGYRSIPFKPEAFDKAARDMFNETGRVTLLTETEFFSAQANSDKTRVEAILVRDLKSGDVTRIRAKVFVDSTGSVWLCRALGCETFLGIDPQSRFGEPSAPETVPPLQLNAMTRCYRVEPRENPKREIIAPEDVVPFPKCAYITGWSDGPRLINMLPTLPGSDLIELGYDECMRRSELIVRNHWSFMQEFPEFQNYELVEIAPMMGIREDYRVKTKYVLVESDIFAGWDGQNHPDRIAIADHPCDIHGKGGGLRPVSTAYGIPYRCLIPDASYQNLLVACRGAGFSRIAAASCRLQRTMIQLGHAAGVAAAWACQNAAAVGDVEKINVEDLTKKLDAHSRYDYW